MEDLVMDLTFWSAKRVLITGHTGFKGSWLSLWLQDLGADVLGYALDPPSSPNLFSVADVAAGMKSVFGDVRDLEHLNRAIAEHRPEIVFHLAAQALVRPSYLDPVETYATNVMGTVNVLEAVRRTKSVKSVVVITSDKCYENREWVWGYRENEPMGGYDPYSSSKGCAELVAAAYRSSFFNVNTYSSHGVGLATARAGNVIGGGDWAVDRLIPDIVRALSDGSEVVIRNPNAIRPWQHVLEPLHGYLILAQKLYESGPEFGEAWNFGPSDDGALPVSWIVDVVARKWGDGARYRCESVGANLHEAHYLKLDCSKAESRLDWHPCWTLSEALDRIVDWYKAMQAGRDMRAETLAQIHAYSGTR